MVLTAVSLGPFYELSYHAALFQDTLFCLCVAWRVGHVQSFGDFLVGVSNEYTYLTIVLFTDTLAALIATLHHWMPSHKCSA